MASVTLTLTDTCAGGGHFTLTLSGDASGSKIYTLEEIRDLMNTVDREMVGAVILRLAQQGRNNQQLRNLLLGGVTVTV
jgi:hypothetical protein